MRLKFLPYILCLLLIASCGTKKQFVISYYKGYPQYDGESWVRNISKPYTVTSGLDNKHVTVWQSHGKYYSAKSNKWEWQRPYMNETREDTFTRTIVVPFLIPMLENAGATVFTPRERDEQTEEVIVDGGKEFNIFSSWEKCPASGFASVKAVYDDSEKPFSMGGTKMVKASKKTKCELQFVPKLNKSGNYAVYVSYPEYKGKNIPDAHYTVCHGGTKTELVVNQRMGQGTWVYLGTFYFENGNPERNFVSLSNKSQSKGFVTADAVRFGGGMGRTQRGGKISGEPRCNEAARYSAQWYGAPDSVYSRFKRADDYKDDIAVRPRMVNWLSGGSCFNPKEKGLNVPMELSLAVHSDAGIAKDSLSFIGTLAICTTDFNGGKLGSGASRSLSKEFATMLQNNIYKDVVAAYGSWNKRGTWDKNYGETRVPEVPSAIIEVLSHECPSDMKRGHDPQFRFTLARSMYKTILRFLAERHGTKVTVQPLPPKNLVAMRLANGKIQVQWEEQLDSTEPTSRPDAYILYIGKNGDYDNGQIVKNNAISLKAEAGATYKFKVTAVNAGGESLPAETVCAE